MKHLSLHDRTEVLPALQGRRVAPAPTARPVGARLKFAYRATRSKPFPVEQSLARLPEPSRLGRILDIEV